VLANYSSTSRKREQGLPVTIRSIQEANNNIIWRTIRIRGSLAELGSHTIVGALEDLASRESVAPPVPAILVAVAVRLDAGDLAFNLRNRHVEVVAAATAAAATCPAVDVPGPVLGNGDLAGLENGGSEGASREGEEGGERNHIGSIKVMCVVWLGGSVCVVMAVGRMCG
jgi:hypothetical protein